MDRVELAAGERAHADTAVALVEEQPLLRVESEESLVEAKLRLAAEAVVHTREHDDQPIPGVRRLGDESDVVGGLARLDLADDHPASIPRTRPGWVLESSKDLIADLVEASDRPRRPVIDVLEEAPVALPEAPGDLTATLAQPLDVVLLVVERRL